MVVKDFASQPASPSAQFDISNGTFTFIAGEMAKAGQVEIDTPFGRIRGRARTGGIGMLSLASLFFAAMEQVDAAPSDTSFLDDGNIRFKDLTSDYGVVELTTIDGRTILINDPGETVVLRRIGSATTESHVTNSLATMLSYQSDQANALHIFSMGPSGPAGNGSNGSSTPPPVLPPIIPINLGTQPPPFDPPHFTLPPPGGANNILDIFVPTPETLPPPVPPSLTISPTINTSTGLTTTIASGGLTKANTLTIMGTVTGDDLSSVSVHVLDQFNGTTTDLGAATIDPSGNWSLQTPQLGDGSHTFTAEAFSNASTPAFAGPVTATVDTVPPTVTISTNDSSLKIGDVAHLTFTLSEADANFSVNDIVVTGGTLSNFAGSGTSFTADFTPLSKSTTPATVDVAGATFTDAAGNDNLASPPLIMTVNTVSAATWSISGDTSVTEGNAANYTVHLAGTLQAGQTATIHLAVADITTTSADYASFVAAVNTAITGRADLSFDANTGTLTYTGDGSNPMADLVIHLGAVNDSLVEGPEQYQVVLSTPGTTTVSDITLGTSEVTTTIIDINAATWSISGDASVTEGTAANYTVHLAGTLAANETATIHLAIANITTTSADYANFVAAVNTAITGRTDLSFDANSGTLTYTGTGSPMADLVIHLGAVNDGLVEGPEQYSVSLSNPGSTSGANVAGTGSVTTTIIDTNAATWSISGDASVTEGNVANYTVHLAGTLAANETATTHLAIANITTTSADYANFVAAVNTAITGRTDLSFDANSGTLTYTGTGSPMADLVIHLGTVNDSQLEGNEQYSVSLSNPGSTTGADVVGTASVITTIIDNDPTAGTPITLQVDEAALSTGSNPSLTTETANGPLSFTAAGFNLVSFAFSTDISGLTTDLNNDGTQDIFWVRDSGTQISGYLDAAHTELADRLTLSAPPGGIAAGATGSVTVTETLSAALKNPNDNGAQVSSLGHVGVVATDTNGDTATGTVNPFDKDDVPTASPASNSEQAVAPDTNLLITLDLSGSMGDPSGVGGLTKLQLAEQAVLNLMQQYDTLGHVKVELVTFSDSARDASGGWVDLSDPAAKANLINIILGLSAGGNTNYAAALTADMADYAATGKLAGSNVQNVAYFLSDGQPTSGDEITGGLNTGRQGAWTSFLNTNDIDSFALGMGTASNQPAFQAALNPIAFDGRGSGTDTNGIVVTDLSQLVGTLVSTVNAAPVTGNLIGGLTANLGADGGHFLSLVVNGVDGAGTSTTYTFDPTSATPITVSGISHEISFNASTDVLTVHTVSGTLALDMGGANVGQYVYTPSASVTSATEQFGYNVVDGDGDTAGSTLTVTISPPPASATNQVLIGGSNADTLNGGQGDDILIGNGGNDTLNG
ncbi:MAG: Ig-like domain-containing protein, partial [Pseudolabrys sp.]